MLRSLKKILVTRLRAKIIGGYLLILFLMNAVGWLAFLQFHSLNREVAHLTQDVARELRISESIVFQTLSLRSSVDAFLAFQKREDDDRAGTHVKNLRLLLHDAEREIKSPDSREDLKNIGLLVDDYVEKYKNAVLRLQAKNENVVKMKAEGANVTKRVTEFTKSAINQKGMVSLCVDLSRGVSEIQEKIDLFLFTHEDGTRSEALSKFAAVFEKDVPALASALPGQASRDFKSALEIVKEEMEDYQDTFSGLSSIILKLDSEIRSTLNPYAPRIVSLASQMAERGWREMDRARVEVDEGISSTCFAIIFLCSGATLLGFLIGMLLSGRITRPLVLLESSARKLAGGDLSLPVEVRSVDEVGGLADAFEKMRRSLKDMIETLEQKVQARTVELSRTNRDLEAAKEELSAFNRELERKVQEQVAILQKSDLLKRYLAPQLIDEIMSGKRAVSIQHERRKLTIFFSDIKGFTQITDSMEAEELSELLNEYLSEMNQIAFAYGGTIDKFIGDAIMIFFGAPGSAPYQENARQCVLMAMAMRDKMKELRKTWVDRGFEFPLEIRIGINTGYATVGNFGSDSRMDYTAIGGQVNLASRLESGSEPGEITISHSTYALVKDIVECKYTGTLNVKGIAHPVMTYKVLHLKEAS